MNEKINNILSSMDAITCRRFAVGAGFALPIAFILSMVLPSPQSIQDVMQFDSHKIQLHPKQAVKDVENSIEKPGETNETKIVDRQNFMDKANRYPAFSKNLISLSAKQNTAIIDKTPRITIIVSNLGKSRKIFAKAIELLPSSTTLSLSPYVADHTGLVRQTSEYGFETWMDIAALTLDKTADHGELALNPTYNFERNIRAISAQLDGKDKITGLLLPPQALIVETPSLWEDLVSDLFDQGYGILDNSNAITSPKLFFDGDHRAPYIQGDKTLNTNTSLANIQNALDKIATDVQKQKNIILTFPISTPASLDILSDWINSLEQKSITLVPLSAQAQL